jgi:inner membrane protein
MDSITHIALGACMGEAFAGKKLGKKAMIWGAVAQSIPDIDFVAGFWMDVPSELLAHRGFTHSLLFLFLITPFMALAAEKWHRPHNISFKKWLTFFLLVVAGHLFVDAFNNYGIGWFEPFTHDRISFHAVYVADPFFSIWPLVAMIALILLKRNAPKRIFWWKFGLFMSAIYLSYCVVNKSLIDKRVQTALQKQHIPYTRYFTTPAPLQNWLWFVVAGNKDGYHTGFYSLFDSNPRIAFEYFPAQKQLLDSVTDHEVLQKLIRFSQNYYTAERWGDTLVFNDLRFGQVIGWHNPREKFVFHYYLSHPNDNQLVVQRGRFAKWDLEIAQSFLKRIYGN